MLKQNEAFVNVTPGGWASSKVDRGNYILALLLKFGGTAFDIDTHVEFVEVMLNEKPIVPQLTGTELKQIMQARGLYSDETEIAIDFIDRDAINAGSLYIGGIDTAKGVTSLIVRVKLAAGAPADTTIKLIRDEVPPLRDAAGALAGLREFKAFSRSLVPAPAADLYTLQPDTGKREKVLRLFCLGATIEYIGVRRDGLTFHDDILLADNDRDLRDYGLTPVAGVYMVNFVKRGDHGEALDKSSAGTLSYRVKTTGAGNVPVIEEKLTFIENI